MIAPEASAMGNPSASGVLRAAALCAGKSALGAASR